MMAVISRMLSLVIDSSEDQIMIISYGLANGTLKDDHIGDLSTLLSDKSDKNKGRS